MDLIVAKSFPLFYNIMGAESINTAIPSFVIWNSLEIPKIPKIPKSVQGKIIVDMFYS